MIKVPHFLPGSAHHERSGLNLIFVKRLTQAARENGIDLVHERLACRQAKIVNLGNSIVGIPADAQNQAQAQRLFPLIGCYGWS